MNRSDKLREEVCTVYSAVAKNPRGKHPFPVGRDFAESLGYPPDVLDKLSSTAIEAFTGVSNVSVFAEIPEGATVLDLGCGGGLDSLIVARRVGLKGKVVAVDFSDSMIARARQAAAETGLNNLDFRKAPAENLPIDDHSIDLVLVNGIFNLNPKRDRIFLELARVMRKGGALYGAELILRLPLPSIMKRSKSNWFAWIAGAKEGGAFLKEFKDVGFSESVILRTSRNARTKNPLVLAADVYARI